MAAFEIDDRDAAMSHPYPRAAVEPFVVRPAMPQGVRHLFQQRRLDRCVTPGFEDARNTAHMRYPPLAAVKGAWTAGRKLSYISSYLRTIESIEKFSRTLRLPAFPNSAHRPASACSRSSKDASCRQSPTGNSNPDFPLATTSGFPPVAVTATGSAAPIANGKSGLL